MKIGAHDLDFEPPDLALLRVRGEATASDTREVGDAIVAFSPGGRVFLLSHIESGHDDSMSGEARKTFIERMKHVTLVAVAVVGGDFRARVLSRLLDGAMRVLSRSPTRLKFFDETETARAFLGEQGCQACTKSEVI